MSEAAEGERNAADVDFIKALAELLDQNNLTEIAVTREYDANDVLKVRVSRQTQPSAPAPMTASSHGAHQAQASAPYGSAGPEPQPAAALSADPAEHPGAVTSPMVGTAYLAADPDAAPFVSVGDKVEAGMTLLIIEAMKTMNQIPAPHGGTVRRILVTNGTPVEYGAPLMIID